MAPPPHNMKTDSMQRATGLANRVVCPAQMGVFNHALRQIYYYYYYSCSGGGGGGSGFTVMYYHCVKTPKSPKYPSVGSKMAMFLT